jgi:hypothetical protein
MRWALPILLLAACATSKPAELLIEEVPRPPSKPELGWREDGEDALDFARSKNKPALLYFTALW